jgi:hypothetical protein
MKKLLLLAILALSVNVNAQDQKSVFTQKSSIFNPQFPSGGILPSSSIIQNSTFNIQHPLADRSLIQIYDSIYHWGWDGSNGWRLFIKYTNIIYNENNYPTNELRQAWNEIVWVNDGLITFGYDTYNNMTFKLEQNWNGTIWQNDYQYTYSYDGNNNQTILLYQTWNGSAWANDYQNIYTYDNNNNLISELQQSWNSGEWLNEYKNIYTYDARRNRISELYQSWSGTAWLDNDKYTMTYDDYNYLVSALGQLFTGYTWENLTKITFTYDVNHNLTSRLEQGWNGSTWGNNYRSTYTYDANDNQIYEFSQMWRDYTWVNHLQVGYTYDENHFSLTNFFKYWNSLGTEIMFGDSVRNYYHTVVGIYEPEEPVEIISVYPNPNHGNFIISSPAEISAIEIYNLTGQMVYSDPGPKLGKSTQIDITGQAKGIYFVKINAGKEMKAGISVIR